MKTLPIGKHTFADIRHDNMLYVDKTAYIHRLITRGSAYFLSRPRRFGKSLTLSTLDAIFSGKRDLFDGLAIAETDYKWETFPVLRFDMSEMDKTDENTLKKSLTKKIEQLTIEHTLSLDPDLPLGQYFASLIKTLHAKSGKVVVLIDEYDAPVIHHITNIPRAIALRDALSDFYTILKVSDEHLRFVMLTGVSKFSKAGIFSKINHLTDLTMHPAYATLCGYTQTELELYFADHITALATNEPSSNRTILLEKIRHWYNGYHFCDNAPGVYNPYSTLNLFEARKFKNYWFESGTPNFLISLIKEKHYDLENAEKTALTEDAFSTYELENLNISALLFQTGYLTIADYREDRMLYQLAFPNFEVRHSFFEHLLHVYTENHTFAGGPLWTLIDALNAQDVDLFFKTLTLFFAKIPYTIQLKDEKYYQTIFYTIFTLIKLKIAAEVCTNTGRIDALVETVTHVYVFEFKVLRDLNSQTGGLGTESPEEKTPSPAAQRALAEAMAQIDSKDYTVSFQDTGKTIVKVAAVFSVPERNIVAWTQS